MLHAVAFVHAKDRVMFDTTHPISSVLRLACVAFDIKQVEGRSSVMAHPFMAQKVMLVLSLPHLGSPRCPPPAFLPLPSQAKPLTGSKGLHLRPPPCP